MWQQGFPLFCIFRPLKKKKKVGRSHFFELGKFGARVMAWFTLKQLRFRAFLSPLRILLPAAQSRIGQLQELIMHGLKYPIYRRDRIASISPCGIGVAGRFTH